MSDYTWGRGWTTQSVRDREDWQLLKFDGDRDDPTSSKFPTGKVEVILGGIDMEWQARAISVILNADDS